MNHEVRKYVWERDGRKCTKCGSRIDLQIHHVEPRARGGDDSAENLVLLCVICHSKQPERGHALLRARARKVRAARGAWANRVRGYIERRARREWECEECRCVIEPGELYYFKYRASSPFYFGFDIVPYCWECVRTEKERYDRKMMGPCA